jgi:ABC-2 type transport system ATP-binding protein
LILTAIKTERLSKHFGTVVALDNLDLELWEGSVFGFLGPNGAGKTTTIKLLMGLSKPTSGRAWVAGEQVSPESLTLKQKAGYLPEVPAFYDWMTGYEFLYFVAELFDLSPEVRTKRIDELLELVRLKKASNRKIGGYSRGMRQRLGIAQALINHPPVLFLDEPCSALDPLGRKEVLDLISRLKDQATIFMSTHILADVERVCDTVGIINQGRLVAKSTVEELRQQHSSTTFELEFEEDAGAFIEILKIQRWLDKLEEIDVSGTPVLRINVRDIQTARNELLMLVANSGLTLRRYELSMPSLEDVFITMVNQAE